MTRDDLQRAAAHFEAVAMSFANTERCLCFAWSFLALSWRMVDQRLCPDCAAALVRKLRWHGWTVASLLLRMRSLMKCREEECMLEC